MATQHALSRVPESLPMWPSVARIAATFAIFVFHFLGLFGLNQHRLSMYALYTFAFLTGYLAQHRGVSQVRWALKRYLSVMIPYWLIIGPVLAANWWAHYKPVTPAAFVVTLLGGNLFLDNPVYVITWYVTFVLLLYVYLLIDSHVTGLKRVAVSVAGYVVFSAGLACGEYFIPFLAGMYLGGWIPLSPIMSRGDRTRQVARGLFRVQRLCYPFFLTHGGLQLALVRLTSLSPSSIFVVSFVATLAAALVVDRVSDTLLAFVTGRLARKRHSVEHVAIAI